MMPISSPWKELTVVLMMAVLASGCSLVGVGTPEPLSGPPAEAFIVSTDAFPPDWEALPCESSLCGVGESVYETDFIPVTNEPGHFRQEVWRFDSPEAASAKYSNYLQADFNDATGDPTATPFLPPTELPYVSNVADEYYFACGRDQAWICRLNARYRQYFVYFYFDMDDGRGYGLTYSEVERILHWLDDRAVELLNVPSPQTNRTSRLIGDHA